MNTANHPFTNHRVDRRLKIPAYFSTSLLQCHNFYAVKNDGNRNEGGLHGCSAAYQYIMFVFHVIVPPPPSYFSVYKKYGHEEGRTANNGHRDNILCGMGLLLHGSKAKLKNCVPLLCFVDTF